MLGVTINGKHYGLFGPTGSTWAGLEDKALTNHSGREALLLPGRPARRLRGDARPLQAIRLRPRHRHAGRVGLRPEDQHGHDDVHLHAPRRRKATTRARCSPSIRTSGGTPATRCVPSASTPSVRGKMKLAEGDSFRTTMRFPGVLPALPNVGGADKERIAGLPEGEVEAPRRPESPTPTADGKWLGKIATLIPIAEQYGQDDAARRCASGCGSGWRSGSPRRRPDGRPKDRGPVLLRRPLGHADRLPGQLRLGRGAERPPLPLRLLHPGGGGGRPPRPGLGRGRRRWGGMVKLLIRDIADPDRDGRAVPVPAQLRPLRRPLLGVRPRPLRRRQQPGVVVGGDERLDRPDPVGRGDGRPRTCATWASTSTRPR